MTYSGGSMGSTTDLEFFASCLPGFEQALASELKALGVKRARPLGGGVAFFGSAQDAMRACLWSRIASRVLLVVARVGAKDADELYAAAYALAWEDVLAPGASMAVRAHGTNENLRNTRFTALKVKDAIVDRLREIRAARPDIDAVSPRAAVDVRIHNNKATLSLDFSGEALSHRAYLTTDDGEDAALECLLAAGALALAGWHERAQAGHAFVEPTSSDGIMLTEASAIACDLAPGLAREKWGFMGWTGFASEEWDSLHNEAQSRFEAGLVRVAGEQALEAAPSARPDIERVRFVGASSSSPAISRARDHIRRAGLRQVASVELADAESIGALVGRVIGVARKAARAQRSDGQAAPEDAPQSAPAVMVAGNLDAQARSDARANVQADEAIFAAACTAAPAQSLFVAIGVQDLPERFGVEPLVDTLVGRGRVETRVLVYDQPPEDLHTVEVPDLAGGAPRAVDVFEAASEQFAARLRKVFKERRKWAAREGVTCYRIYDSDLPDYAVAIDLYTGAGDARGNTYLHISEYAPPASIDPGKARRRFNDVLALAPVVCGIRPDHVFAKTRVRDKGGSQYRNARGRSYVTTVEEGGYLFEVDLAGRLDTGIFLDHRDTRALVRSRAQGGRFLNLFAYTGTASVYAAGGGAVSTTTVDMSQTYLDWARRNMAANGFSGAQHTFVKSDVARWITQTRRSADRFDLVFVDPPTFSNSKTMGKRTWDVQRDHVELLIGVTRLLSDEGVAIFSCNLRTFKPYVDQLEKYGVAIEEISADTIPVDFARTPKIHKCYLVKRTRA